MARARSKRYSGKYRSNGRRSGAMVLAAALVVAMAASIAVVSSSSAQTEQAFARTVAGWDGTFEEIERYMVQSGVSPTRTTAMRDRLENIRADAEAVRQVATDELARVAELLEALGEPVDGVAEAPDIAGRRTAYQVEAGLYRARIQNAALAMARAGQIDARLSQSTRLQLATRIFESGPLPYMPGTLAAAGADARRIASRLATAWVGWQSVFAATEGGILKAVLLWAIALALGLAARRFLPPLESVVSSVASGAYHRRLLAVLDLVVRRGAVPVLLLLATGFAVGQGGGLAAATFSGFISSLAFCLAAAIVLFLLARAAASGGPDMSILPEIPADRTAGIARLVGWLGFLAGIDLFITGQLGALDAGASFSALVGGAVHLLEALTLLALARALFWPLTPSDGALRRIVKWLLVCIAGAAVLAVLAGYARLGEYLAHLPLLAGGTALVLLVLRRLVHAIVLSAHFPASTDTTADTTANIIGGGAIHFWLGAIIDVAAVLLWILFMAPFVGVAGTDLQNWAAILLTDLDLGNISISILDIVVAITVFMAALAVTRALQKSLSERVLPRTQIDISIQHSLATTFGYIGIVISGVVAVAVLGIDLTGLAVIAGAFSVGIGFGLQNIVNNFVSGLILLVQRPIKVGDWVMVGEHQGIIKRIGVRATELETFQRASVIIPNSELVSGRVTNWTHDNRYGRVELAVGVGYDSDPAQVKSILLACAADHPEVSRSDPEPFVMFQDFADSCLMFELRCVTPDVMRRAGITSELRYEIIRRFREAGIEIPFPQRVVHLQDETSGS